MSGEDFRRRAIEVSLELSPEQQVQFGRANDAGGVLPISHDSPPAKEPALALRLRRRER
jgi:hypothetical protein